MASIWKRTWSARGVQKSAWAVDYTDQHGKRRRRTFTRKKEADAFSVTLNWELVQGVHTPDSQSITVAEAADLWIERGKTLGLERGTLDNYQEHLDHHIVPMIGHVKLSRLTAPSVQRFIDGLLSGVTPDREKRSQAMTRKLLTSLKSIISEAQKRGLVAQNVAREISFRASARHQHVVEIPSKDDVRKLLLEANGRWRPIIVLAIFTGMRSSELRGLTWDDVDFAREIITVRQRADRWNEMGNPKSAAGRREIPMTPMVCSTLREWKLACPLGKARLVIPNGRGNVESHANIVNRGLRPLQVKCDIVNAEGKAQPSYIPTFFCFMAYRTGLWAETGSDNYGS